MEVVSFFNLKKGVSKNDYKKWAKEVDMNVSKKIPGIKSFEIFEISKVKEKEIIDKIESKSDYEFMEVVKLDNLDSWNKMYELDFMKEVIEEWYKFVDKYSIKAFYANEI